MTTATATATQTRTTQQLQLLDIGRVRPAPDNLREDLGDLKELAASIKTVGILEPILVTGNGDGVMTVVAGHRRLAAAKLAGLTEVPTIVREFSDVERQEAMLIENLQRKDLDPIEEAKAYKRLIDLGNSQGNLAERIGRSQSHISKRLALLQLPAPALEKLHSGGINVQDALELTKLAPHPKRLEAALKNNNRWDGIAGAVDMQLREQKEADARSATRSKLQSAGVKILREDSLRSTPMFYGVKERPLAGQSHYDCLKLTIEQHKDKSCHAVIINSDGSVTYVCKNPSNHPGQLATSRAASMSPAEKGEHQRQMNEKKARVEAREARAKVLRSLLKDVKKGASAEFILVQLLTTAGADEARIAEELLGLEPPKRGSVYAPDVVLTYAQRGTRELWRAAMAVAFGAAESNLRTGYAYRGAKSKVARHLALLEKAGYKATSAEKGLAK